MSKVQCTICKEWFDADEINWQEPGRENEPLCGTCAVDRAEA